MPKEKVIKESEKDALDRKRIIAKQEGKDVKIEKLEDLPHIPGELDLRDLPDGDKFQLLTRYFNDQCIYLKNIMLSLNELNIAVHIIGKSFGIDIEKIAKEAQAKALEGIIKQKQPIKKEKNYKN